MGELLRRRAMLGIGDGGAEGPKNPIPDGIYAKWGGLNAPTQCEITNHNHAHLTVGTSGGNGGCYMSPQNQIVFSSGDVIEFRVYNVNVISSGTFSTTRFIIAGGSGNSYDIAKAGFLPNGGLSTVTANRNFSGALAVYINWKSGTYEIEFDFELWINGKWYC